MEATYELLSSQPFLAGLTQGQLDRLSYWARKATFHAGTRLFEENRRADRFWLLREGHVTLDTHVPGRGTVIMETLGPQAVLGWSWLFPPYRWHFSASAVETTLAVEFDGPGVRELCERDHDLGYDLKSRFLTVVVDRMQATRLRLLDLYGRPA